MNPPSIDQFEDLVNLSRYEWDLKFKGFVDTIEKYTREKAEPTTNLIELGKVWIIVGLKLSNQLESARSFGTSLIRLSPFEEPEDDKTDPGLNSL